MKKTMLLLAACILTSLILLPSPIAWADGKPNPKPPITPHGPTAPDGAPLPWPTPTTPNTGTNLIL